MTVWRHVGDVLTFGLMDTRYFLVHLLRLVVRWRTRFGLLVFPVGVETIMSEIDIFVSSTGVITLDHMRKFNDITLVGNTEHFDNEIDFAGSTLFFA